jgi:guanylate kinase
MSTSSSDPHFPAVSLVSRRGLLLVLSSPSGAGKTTIARNLLAVDPLISSSNSVTTRGRDPASWRSATILHRQAAHRRDGCGGRAAGTRPVSQLLRHAEKSRGGLAGDGRDVAFDIDWQGTPAVGGKMSADQVRFFVLPPSMSELERRLRARASGHRRGVAGTHGQGRRRDEPLDE